MEDINNITFKKTRGIQTDPQVFELNKSANIQTDVEPFKKGINSDNEISKFS